MSGILKTFFLHLPLLLLYSGVSTACESHGHLARVRRSESSSARSAPLSPQERTLLDSFNNVTVAEWSFYYTHGAHLAGKNRTQAQWTADKWSSYGVPAHLAEYEVYLNYPVSHSLSLTYSNASVFHARLAEDEIPEDPTTTWPNRIPTFNGYSFSGSAKAEYVYVGRGSASDFKRLIALGVDLKGKIALAKYGGPFRGLKVKNAQEYGMVGTILFTDPGDDGNVTVKNGYLPYPKGPARQPSSVQRGSVEFLSIYPGDPTTPGVASLPGVNRTGVITDVTPKIPSIPVSELDIQPLLKALDGHGKTAKEVNLSDWTGLLDTEYSTGPAPGAVVSLSNVMESTYTPIWDAIGFINGTIEDEVIVIGNHRDAWIVGGAADPNSGSAVLVELAKAFGKLQETGWKPKRTIVLASWDAEEYGLIGSTEFFEQYTPWALANVVAYINLDVAVCGPRLVVDAVPELHDIITTTFKKVSSPTGNGSLYDAWENKDSIGVLGSGSDYTSFVTNGIASLDFGFGNGPMDPVYHYHSNYDSYYWMTTYGDPEFKYHVAAGQFVGLLAMELADADVIPMNTTAYTEALGFYFDDLKQVVSGSKGKLDLGPIDYAIGVFGKAAKHFDSVARKVGKYDDFLRKTVNYKLKTFERAFAHQGGLPGREFYKHVIYAPGLDTGYAPVTFPGVTEAVGAGNFTLAKEWVWKTANGILEAAGVLAI